jgi:protein ImuB
MPPLFASLRSSVPSPSLAAIALAFSPRLRRHGDRTVVLDVSGLERLLGDPVAIGGELVRMAAAAEVAVRVAVAPTQTAALLMTLVPAETPVVVAGPVAPALAALPLAHLQQLVAEAAGTTLRRGSAAASATRAAAERQARAFDMADRWGVRTLGELAALPTTELSARMGQDGVRLQALARGEDEGPLVPDPDVPRFQERLELEWPIDTLEPLSFVLARLLDPLAAALERADRGAVTIRLDLRLVDRTTHARVLPLPAPMRDARVLRTLLLLDLESHPPPAAIDVVTLEADPAPGRALQYSLLERALPSPETLATLTARLHALVGESRCGSAALRDTHRPDGFELRPFAPSPMRTGGLAVPPAAGPDADGDGRIRVPLVPVLRRFRPPVAVRVGVDAGRPVRVAIDRRGMPGGEVMEAAGPWRTSGEWWDRPAGHWDRDEWDVALADGSVCRLYRERESGTWFVEGVLD